MKIHSLRPELPPSTVYSYFLKTYFKNKSKLSNKKKKLVDAFRMWRSLSTQERDQFRVKLEEAQCQYELKYAQYLNNLQPYLKKKHGTLSKELDAETFPEDESDNTNAEYEEPGDIIPDCSTPQEDDKFRLQDVTVTHSTEKPIPPPKDARELYLMMHEDTTDQEMCMETWRKLPAAQKARYRNAVKCLKNDYMDKYRTYLLSLSATELANQLKQLG